MLKTMKLLCRICKRIAKAQQLCPVHYRRWKRHGDPLKGARHGKASQLVTCIVKYCKRPPEYKGRCSFHFSLPPLKHCGIPNCHSPIFVGALCGIHYHRLAKLGRAHTIRRPDGQGYQDERGYIYKCIKGRRISFHRWLMEQKLRRKLKRHEFVHHIDHNKSNNDINNLTVIESGKHSRLHNRKWTKEGKHCIKCHKFLPLIQFRWLVKHKYLTARCHKCRLKNYHHPCIKSKSLFVS